VTGARDAAFAPRRIVVALDASPGSRGALETAVVLARQLGAELVGVFVEDVNLLRLGALAGGQVSLASGRREAFDSAQASAQLRALAWRAREALRETAFRHGAQSSFRVVRGTVGAALVEAAGDADLLVIGAHGRAPAPLGLGRTARQAAAGSRRPVLLLPGFETGAGSVAVLVEPGPLAGATLAAAAALARAARVPLTALVAAGDGAALVSASEGARDALRRHGIEATVVSLLAPSPERLLLELRRIGPGRVVLAAGGPLAGEAGLDRLLAELGRPVLIVR
jgi:nucleotide-binding universal stress UspA family protein